MFGLLRDRFKGIVTAGIILIFFSGCVPPETDMSHQNVQPIMSSQAKVIGAELQKYLDDKIKRLNIPGVSLFVDIPGQIPLSISSGFSNIELKTSLNPSDKFRIASITKTFTAAAILLLTEDGLLELADPVEKWLPGSVSNAEKITIRQLLNHTSGISDYYQGEKGIKKQVAASPHKIWSQLELIGTGVSMSPLFEPGQKWAYSNTAYIILGLIIEKASGTSYRDFVHKRILELLNLEDTFVPLDGNIPGNYAHGYIDTIEDGKLKDVTDLHPSVVWSAGSMVSTTKDLARWAKAIYGGELLSDDSMREMFSVVDIGYEGIKYGLGVYEYQEGIVGHDGDFMGYSSQIVYVVDSKLTIGVLTNRLPPHATEIAIEVLQLLSKETSGRRRERMYRPCGPSGEVALPGGDPVLRYEEAGFSARGFPAPFGSGERWKSSNGFALSSRSGSGSLP